MIAATAILKRNQETGKPLCERNTMVIMVSKLRANSKFGFLGHVFMASYASALRAIVIIVHRVCCMLQKAFADLCKNCGHTVIFGDIDAVIVSGRLSEEELSTLKSRASYSHTLGTTSIREPVKVKLYDKIILSHCKKAVILVNASSVEHAPANCKGFSFNKKSCPVIVQKVNIGIIGSVAHSKPTKDEIMRVIVGSLEDLVTRAES